MISIARIELRRSGALWASLLVLGVSAGLLYNARMRWPSGYMLLAMDQRWYLSLLAALAVAAGAFQARRERRSQVMELFASVARPRAQQVVPLLLVYGVTAFLAYIGAWVLAALSMVGTAEYLQAGAVAGVVVAGAVATVAAAWFGLAVGRMAPNPLTAPALAIAVFATPLIARGVTGRREWLSTLLFSGYGLGGSPTDFATVPGRFSLAQLLYLTGLAAGLALLFAADRWRSGVAAVLPVLLGVAAAVVVLQGGSAFVKDPIDPVARELICTRDAPRVCVARLHSGVLGEVTPPARAALARLARLPGAPSRAAEHLDGDPLVAGRYPDSLLIPVTIGEDGHANHLDTLEAIMVYNVGVRPFVCPDDAAGPDAPVVDAATAWLFGTDPAELRFVSAADIDRSRELWRKLRDLDEPDAAARVAAVRRAVLTCSPGDDLLLTRPAP